MIAEDVCTGGKLPGWTAMEWNGMGMIRRDCDAAVTRLRCFSYTDTYTHIHTQHIHTNKHTKKRPFRPV